MGEIYFRMVRCLYKKFTIRKGIDFNTDSFDKVMTSLGKVALETLLSGNALLQRSQVKREVGDDAFDFGLLIGHEDAHRLIRDETADIFVTFPHRSILEFLAAFYFVLCPVKGVKHFKRAFAEYLKNPLFSQFCLWFLDESNELSPIPKRSVSRKMLSRWIAEKIDDGTMDFSELQQKFPALGLALNDYNDLALGILKDALKRCWRVRYLVVSNRHPVDHILKSLSCNVFESLKSISINDGNGHARLVELKRNRLIPQDSPLLFLHSWTDNDLEVSVRWCDILIGNRNVLVSVLNICATRNRSLFVRFCGPLADISQFLRESLPSLHTLVLVDTGILDLKAVALANVKNKIPNLCVLDFSNTVVNGQLNLLLDGIFPSLITLILSGCHLNTQDISSLVRANEEGKLPELKHLDISRHAPISQNAPLQPLEHTSLVPLFSEPSLKLTSLIARGRCLDMKDWRCLAEASGAGRHERLTSIDFTLNPSIAGHLSVFLCRPWLSLSILILRKCELTWDDMHSLARASAENKLPELRHLDVSLNPIGCKSGSRGVSELLSYKFSFLAYLILCRCGLNYWDLDSLTQAKLAGKLPALRYLDISLNGLTGHHSHLTRDRKTGRKVSWGKIVCFE